MNSDEDNKSNGIVIPPTTALVRLPEGRTPTLSEIVSRSLVHIQTSKNLSRLHRIGEHELYWPDYQLICTWAEEKRMTPGEVLDVLLKRRAIYDDCGEEHHRSCATIKGGHIDWLEFPVETLPGISSSAINGLMIERLCWGGGMKIPFLPNLKSLNCEYNKLASLDLSAVPNLRSLSCDSNLLTDLNLSVVPNIRILGCANNDLSCLDLSTVPNLESLYCRNNQLLELDIRPLSNLKILNYDKEKTRLIQHGDQNF